MSPRRKAKAKDDVKPPEPKVKRGQRAVMCPHRIPPGAFCKRGCDG